MIINAIAIANGGPTSPPVLEPLNATENGTFTPSAGVDGFSPVNVNVQPPLQTKAVEITANGQSTIEPDSEYYGLESVGLNVNVQPNLQTKSININENGQSTVVTDSSFDGLESVDINVNVPIPTFTTEEKNITANGTYTPSTDGYSTVPVNVQPKLQTKSTTTTITSNGTSTISVTPDANYDGLSSASVTITTNVEASGGSSAPIYITNGTKLSLPNNNGEVSDLSGISPIGLTTMANMFENSTTTGILIDGWNVSGVTSIANLLNNCSSLTSLAMKNMNFSNTLTTDNAFDGASSIQTLDFSGSNATFLNNIMTSIYPSELIFRGSTFNSYPYFEYLDVSSVSTLDISDCDMSNITSKSDEQRMFIANSPNITVNENTVLPNCDLDMRFNMNWSATESEIIKFFDCLIPNAGHTVTYLYKMGGNIKSDWATDNVLAFIQSKGWSVAGKSESA